MQCNLNTEECPKHVTSDGRRSEEVKIRISIWVGVDSDPGHLDGKRMPSPRCEARQTRIFHRTHYARKSEWRQATLTLFNILIFRVISSGKCYFSVMKINNIQDDAKHISVNKNTDVVLEIFERD